VLSGSTAGLESLPSHTDGRIYADEEEEGAPHKGINHGFVPYIRQDESLSPSQRDELEQRIDVWKCAP
jgi:hypothetical protein